MIYKINSTLLLIGIILLSAITTVNAQSQKQLVKYADEAFLESDYFGAASYYKKILDLDPSQTEIKYKYAESLRLYNEYNLAERYYADVLKTDRGEKFPECMFWLAAMQKQNGKYEQAKKTFSNVNNLLNSNQESYFFKKSKKEIESCDFAIMYQKTDSIGILNIGSPINTIHSEFSPFYESDTLFFSSIKSSDSTSLIEVANKKNRIKIYKAINKNSKWQQPKELDSTINLPLFNNANFVLNHDKSTAFFSRNNENGIFELYMSEIIDGNPQEAIKLPETINYPSHTTTQPFVSKYRGSEILFFVSDRPGGQGKLDIWYAIIRKEGNDYQFKSPIPLNPNINSIENEITPFFDEENEILYFSSEWHNGFGGFDIFKSIGSLDKLENPENLGLTFNSAANDYYFHPISGSTKKDLKGFIVSNRIGSFSSKGETCCNDIYYFEPLPVTTGSLIVQDQVKKEPKEIIGKQKHVVEKLNQENAEATINLNKFLPLSLYFHNDEPNPKTINPTTKKDYISTYKQYISLLKLYEQEYSNGLEGSKANEAIEDIDTFFEEFVKKGYNELESFTFVLVELLKQDYEIELLVKGYASPLAKTDYNVNLSKRRIASFINHLKSYEQGEISAYLNSKKLIINQEPNGEFKAGKLVSDNLNDKKNSIFSRAAALERKIEVSLVKVTPPNKEKSNIKDEVISNLPPVAELKETTHNFGTIKYGEVVSHVFKVKNTGKEDLIIYNAIGSCGCTVPEWNKEPIKPGEEAEIKVTFDSKGKFGQNKTNVTLITNGSPRTKTLTIEADVFLQK